MSLSEDQQIVVDNPNRNKLVVALPGSGKTHTSIELAQRILNESEHNKLIMVTFTRASTAETRHRISKKVSPDALERCVISTFAKLMKDHAEPLLNKRQLIMGAPHSAFIKRIANGDEDVESYLTAKVYTDYLASEGDLQKMPDIGRRYLKELNRYKKVDLSTLSVELVFALQQGVIEPLDFTHMVVDEFQDTDGIQSSWIKSHKRDDRYFTVVGDDDQSIYGFRGALGIESMTSFQQEFEADGVLLRQCYRCPPEILSAAENLIEENENRLEKEMLSAKPAGGTVSVRRISEDQIYESHELDLIQLRAFKEEIAQTRQPPESAPAKYHDFIEEYVDKVNNRNNAKKTPEELLESVSLSYESHRYIAKEIAKSPEGWAVLARTNMLLDSIEKEFAALNIPSIRLGGRSIWELPEVAGYMALLNSLSNEKNFYAFDDALDFIGVGPADISELHAKALQAKSIKRIASAGMESANSEGYLLFKEFSELTPILERDSEIIAEFLGYLVEKLCDLDSEQLKNTKKYRMINEIMSAGTGTIGMRVANIYRMARSKKEKDHNNSSAVILSTLNGSKGLQWENVWVMDVEPGRIPSRFKGADEAERESFIEEERRLLYVGMTRAEQQLVISYREGKASPFIEDILGYDPEG